jgi:outer membrane scaffolding protein for murein synthesis (MipA/OmpV family)
MPVQSRTAVPAPTGRALWSPGIWVAAAVLALAPAAHADDDPPPPMPGPPAPAAPASAASAPAWHGAIGVTGVLRTGRLGGGGSGLKLEPAFYLRYGRLTITNASGFVARRTDDVVRGLGLDMVNGDRVRIGVSLRYDSGRKESSNTGLTGLGDIPSTVRARLTANLRLNGPWRLGASWNFDLRNRVGGTFGDITGGWDLPLGVDTSMNLGASLTLADGRHMQAYYGITPEQSARSVYPVFNAHGGLRDGSVFANFRHDVGDDWTLLAGTSVSRRLGSAAASPLSLSPWSWGVNAAAGWRF